MKYDPRERKYIVEDGPPARRPRQRASIDGRAHARASALGYDMNSIEFAVRDGVPYAIDFMNPAPDMDINSLTPHYFEWVVKHMADMVIALAKKPRRRRKTSSGARRSRRSSPRWLQRGRSEPAADAIAFDVSVRRSLACATRSRRIMICSTTSSSRLTRRACWTSSAAAQRPHLRRPPALHRASPAPHESRRSHAWLQGRVPRRSCACSPRRTTPRIASREFRRQFLLTDWEETLVADDPGIRNPSPTSRLDAFIVDEDREMKLTEYNAETPAGAAYGDALTDVFIDLPVMRAFARQYEISPIPSRHGVLHVAARDVRGMARPPRAAAHRHRRLAGRADGERVRAVPRLLPLARHRVRHRRPARRPSTATAGCRSAMVIQST